MSKILARIWHETSKRLEKERQDWPIMEEWLFLKVNSMVRSIMHQKYHRHMLPFNWKKFQAFQLKAFNQPFLNSLLIFFFAEWLITQFALYLKSKLIVIILYYVFIKVYKQIFLLKSHHIIFQNIIQKLLLGILFHQDLKQRVLRNPNFLMRTRFQNCPCFFFQFDQDLMEIKGQNWCVNLKEGYCSS